METMSAVTHGETIAKITRRLVEACQPFRVYLFGSAARGDAGPDSDLDFLVVVPDDAPEDVIRGRAVVPRDSGDSLRGGHRSVAALRLRRSGGVSGHVAAGHRGTGRENPV